MLTDQKQVKKDSVIAFPTPGSQLTASTAELGIPFAVARILSPAHEPLLLWHRHALQIISFNGWRLVQPLTVGIFHKVTDETPNLFMPVGTTWLF